MILSKMTSLFYHHPHHQPQLETIVFKSVNTSTRCKLRSRAVPSFNKFIQCRRITSASGRQRRSTGFFWQKFSPPSMYQFCQSQKYPSWDCSSPFFRHFKSYTASIVRSAPRSQHGASQPQKIWKFREMSRLIFLKTHRRNNYGNAHCISYQNQPRWTFDFYCVSLQLQVFWVFFIENYLWSCLTVTMKQNLFWVQNYLKV